MKRPMQLGKSSPFGESDRRQSNITPGHVRAFHMVTSGLFEDVTLWSCTIDGEPGVAIVMVKEVGEGKVAVMPLFVAITPEMKIDFRGEEESGGDDGAGPPRSDVLREFAANLESFTAGGG
jgi:hypothetical protein